MKTLMNLLLTGCLASGAAMAVSATALAADPAGTTPTAKKPVKKSAVKHKAAKHPEKPSALLDEDGKEFKAGDDTATELECELGNKLTLYRNVADGEHMALRWQQRVHRMTRVSTSTGANRFENSRYGLVWIGIPAKGMLLDAKRGQQLANECKDAEQRTTAAVAPVTPVAPAVPAAAVAPVMPATPVTPTPAADVPAPAQAPRADAAPAKQSGQ